MRGKWGERNYCAYSSSIFNVKWSFYNDWTTLKKHGILENWTICFWKQLPLLCCTLLYMKLESILLCFVPFYEVRVNSYAYSSHASLELRKCICLEFLCHLTNWCVMSPKIRTLGQLSGCHLSSSLRVEMATSLVLVCYRQQCRLDCALLWYVMLLN